MPIQNRKIKLTLIFLLIILSISAFSIVGITLTVNKNKRTTPDVLSNEICATNLMTRELYDTYDTFYVSDFEGLRSLNNFTSNDMDPSAAYQEGAYSIDYAGMTIELSSDIIYTSKFPLFNNFAGTFDGRGYTIEFTEFINPVELPTGQGNGRVEGCSYAFCRELTGIVKNTRFLNAKITASITAGYQAYECCVISLYVNKGGTIQGCIVENPTFYLEGNNYQWYISCFAGTTTAETNEEYGSVKDCILLGKIIYQTSGIDYTKMLEPTIGLYRYGFTFEGDNFFHSWGDNRRSLITDHCYKYNIVKEYGERVGYSYDDFGIANDVPKNLGTTEPGKFVYNAIGNQEFWWRDQFGISISWLRAFISTWDAYDFEVADPDTDSGSDKAYLWIGTGFYDSEGNVTHDIADAGIIYFPNSNSGEGDDGNTYILTYNVFDDDSNGISRTITPKFEGNYGDTYEFGYWESEEVDGVTTITAVIVASKVNIKIQKNVIRGDDNAVVGTLIDEGVTNRFTDNGDYFVIQDLLLPNRPTIHFKEDGLVLTYDEQEYVLKFTNEFYAIFNWKYNKGQFASGEIVTFINSHKDSNKTVTLIGDAYKAYTINTNQAMFGNINTIRPTDGQGNAISSFKAKHGDRFSYGLRDNQIVYYVNNIIKAKYDLGECFELVHYNTQNGEMKLFDFVNLSEGIIGNGEITPGVNQIRQYLVFHNANINSVESGIKPEVAIISPMDKIGLLDTNIVLIEYGTDTLDRSTPGYLYYKSVSIIDGVECSVQVRYNITAVLEYGYQYNQTLIENSDDNQTVYVTPVLEQTFVNVAFKDIVNNKGTDREYTISPTITLKDKQGNVVTSITNNEIIAGTTADNVNYKEIKINVGSGQYLTWLTKNFAYKVLTFTARYTVSRTEYYIIEVKYEIENPVDVNDKNIADDYTLVLDSDNDDVDDCGIVKTEVELGSGADIYNVVTLTISPKLDWKVYGGSYGGAQ